MYDEDEKRRQAADTQYRDDELELATLRCFRRLDDADWLVEVVPLAAVDGHDDVLGGAVVFKRRRSDPDDRKYCFYRYERKGGPEPMS